jgi:hypothetical protein
MHPIRTAFQLAAILVLAPLALAAGAPLPLDHAFPAPHTANVCPDTPLRLTFAAAPTLGTAGKIKIIDAADDRVVDEIDVSSPTAVKTIGGRTTNTIR